MKSFEIKITGNGTRNEIATALRNIVKQLEDSEVLDSNIDGVGWEDSVLFIKIDTDNTTNNIFESIQLLYDMDMYKDITGIFKELKDIMPDTIYISAEGISDEKTLFFLNELNGCSLKPYGFYSVNFIKDNDVLFCWDLNYDSFYIDNNKIWKVFKQKYNMTDNEIQQFTKNILEIHCKIMGVTPR